MLYIYIYIIYAIYKIYDMQLHHIGKIRLIPIHLLGLGNGPSIKVCGEL